MSRPARPLCWCHTPPRWAGQSGHPAPSPPPPRICTSQAAIKHFIDFIQKKGCYFYLEEYITVIAHPRGQRSPSNHPPVFGEDRVVYTGTVVTGAQGEGGGGVTDTEEDEDDHRDQDDEGNQDDAASPQPEVVIVILVAW